jgi:hypothetical protein
MIEQPVSPLTVANARIIALEFLVAQMLIHSLVQSGQPEECAKYMLGMFESLKAKLQGADLVCTKIAYEDHIRACLDGANKILASGR